MLNRFDHRAFRAIHDFLDARLYGTAPARGLQLRLLGVAGDLPPRLRPGLRRQEQPDACSDYGASRHECSPASNLLSFVRNDSLLSQLRWMNDSHVSAHRISIKRAK